MSIASEITRISGNIADAYTALDGKGATLPAAGSQNSANLADTIDTITTGGGGSTNPDIATVKQIIANYTDGDSHFQATGIDTSDDNAMLIGVVLDSDITSIRLNENTLKKIAIPSTATFYNDSQAASPANKYGLITFNGDEKWFIILRSSDFTTLPMANQINGADLSSVYIYFHYIYANYKMLEDSTITTINFSDVANGSNVVDFDLDGLTFSDTLSNFSSASFAKLLRLNDMSKFFDKAPNIDVGDSIDYAEMGLSNASGSVWWSLYERFENFPFVIDCSNHSSTSEFTITKAPLCGYMNLKIILPSTCNVNLKQGVALYSSTEMPVVWTKESLQYMATHAPTVSGKTLKIGNLNIAICGGANSSIITTFTGKGWTVQ